MSRLDWVLEQIRKDYHRAVALCPEKREFYAALREMREREERRAARNEPASLQEVRR